MPKLNKRQQEILEFIRRNPDSNNSAIHHKIVESYEKTSRITIIRDLNLLLKEKLIEKKGKGRNIAYSEKVKNKLLRFVDVEDYFKKGPDERSVVYKNFNFNIFDNLKGIFFEDELKKLNGLNKKYQNNIKKISPTVLKKEFQRLSIELSWKSSKIEGNTYSLIDTEILIKENKEAEGHKKEEAIMILNHKNALEYILDNLKKFKTLSLKNIQDVHRIITADLGVGSGIRKRAVGITGTVYKPLDNQYQIKEALEKMAKKINSLKDVYSKAFFAIMLISYIQPCEDGNKRTSRMMANAILLAHNFCPLSFRSVDEVDYKKAIILFYEQNNADFFKKLFIEQFEFATTNYFLL